jgi:hypothetical protein
VETATDAAIRDLEGRTLVGLPEQLSKVIYLSSTRDYNTGEYRHHGLESRYGRQAAHEALARCHETAFRDLLMGRLSGLVNQLASYIETTGADRETVLQNWSQLQAYRVLIPATCDSLSADVFATNLKIALEILRLAPPAVPAHSPGAPPPR